MLAGRETNSLKVDLFPQGIVPIALAATRDRTRAGGGGHPPDGHLESARARGGAL